MSKWWYISCVLVVGSYILYQKYKKELKEIKIEFTLPQEFI